VVGGVSVRVLITGVTGQDGSYLAEQLYGCGYEVFGLIRGQNNPRQEWIKKLVPSITLIEGDLLDQSSLYSALSIAMPDEIYNLAAISAPALGWKQPILTAEVTGLGTLRLLEAMTVVSPQAHFLQASSLALHGPYGAAKTFAQAIVRDYRERGYHASDIVMGGHHSPRRGTEFISRKVTRAAAMISVGKQSSLALGPLDRVQDWGWAPNFTRAMREITRRTPDTYVVSTGDPHSAKEWVQTAFECVNLDWQDYVVQDNAYRQPTDVPTLTAQPDIRLDWRPDRDFKGTIMAMVLADLQEVQ
jgi:GDPmannose 4,6-dehydratase